PAGGGRRSPRRADSGRGRTGREDGWAAGRDGGMESPVVLARVLLLLCALVVAPPGAALRSAVQDARVCTLSCPDDGEEGHCAPDCEACPCCSHVRPLAMTTAPLVFSPVARAEVVEDATEALVSADGGDILHIPKPPLA